MAKASTKIYTESITKDSSHVEEESICREPACENLVTTEGYCRMHYLKNWQKIRRRKEIIKDSKLRKFLAELIEKYPQKYIDVIRHDLMNDENFAQVITDYDFRETDEELLSLDTSNEEYP